MKYFLDTNICIYYLKGLYPQLQKKLLSFSPDTIGIPAMTKAELLLGAEKSSRKDASLAIVNDFLQTFKIYGFNDAEAQVYASIRADLESKGRLIGPNDLIIASIVLANNATLVTHNTKEFNRVNGLPVEDWTQC